MTVEVDEGLLLEAELARPFGDLWWNGLESERVETIDQFPEKTGYYFPGPVEFEEKAKKKFLKPDNKELLETVRDKLSALDDYSHDSLEKLFSELMEQTGKKLGKIGSKSMVLGHFILASLDWQ